VVHAARLSGLEHPQVEPYVRELVPCQLRVFPERGNTAFEDATDAERVVRQPGRVANAYDEPAVSDWNEARPGRFEAGFLDAASQPAVACSIEGTSSQSSSSP